MRHRTRIAEGVYADQYGLAGIVKVGRRTRERRFPRDTDLARIQSWRAQARGELAGERDQAQATGVPEPERGTFAKDLPRYLKLIAGRASFASDRSHLRAWLPFIGPLRRDDIRPFHVQRAFAAWLSAGKSARTIRHRRRVLRELYQGLDGVHARPPIKGTKVPKVDDPHPTPVSHAVIRKVAKSLKAGLRRRHACGPKKTVVLVKRAASAKVYARFLVRATTGQRPSQIMRAERSDIDLKRRIWFVHPGKGGKAIPFPLDPGMVAAWKAFIAADAWGHFDTRSFSKTIRRHGWPEDVRPYQLRHTFAIDHLLAGTSLEDVQGLVGHKHIDTTRRHYAPVLLALLRKAVGRRKLRLA